MVVHTKLSHILYCLTGLLCLAPIGGWADVEALSQASEASHHLDLGLVFRASPVIYTILLLLSVGALSLWLYSLFTLKEEDLLPTEFMHHVRELLAQGQFEQALSYCQENRNFCASILASGIAARRHGPQVMMDVVQSEGKRQGNSLWQRITLLNEVAVVAPMFGLLGTVLGLFFAFYDGSQSPESLAAIFDGLGVAVGTTVAGLIVAIMAMIFYTTLKFRVLGLLNSVENEAVALINLIEQDEVNAKG